MKIIFNLISTGLGNQGGSLTIVKCANTLQELGHDVIIIDSMKNQHTWTPLKVKHLIVKDLNEIPNADAIIATGYKSVTSTLNCSIKCGKKFHYIRGWETWNMNEHDIANKVLKVNTIKIVNSQCLQNKLKQYKIKSIIVRPGYDLDLFYPLPKQNHNAIILGGLLPPKKHFQNKRGEWILNAYKILKKEFNIKLHMFGSENNNYDIDLYLRQPSIEQKNTFYNNIDIWLSTSQLEGLHMPPAEAMMTNCPVIGTNAEMSGTQDYLIHNETGIISNNDFDSFVNAIKKLIMNEKLRIKLGIQARKKIMDIGTRQTNMKHMVQVLQGEL